MKKNVRRARRVVRSEDKSGALVRIIVWGVVLGFVALWSIWFVAGMVLWILFKTKN